MSHMFRNILFALSGVLLIGSFYFHQNYTIFVIQPIGAIPQGATLIVQRTGKLNFVDSADALCDRLDGGVSLFCRMAMLTAAVDKGDILARFPYSAWLYSYSTGGKTFER